MASNHLIQAVGFSAAGLCACIAIAHSYQRQPRAEPTQAGPLAMLLWLLVRWKLRSSKLLSVQSSIAPIITCRSCYRTCTCTCARTVAKHRTALKFRLVLIAIGRCINRCWPRGGERHTKATQGIGHSLLRGSGCRLGGVPIRYGEGDGEWVSAG